MKTRKRMPIFRLVLLETGQKPTFIVRIFYAAISSHNTIHKASRAFRSFSIASTTERAEGVNTS